MPKVSLSEFADRLSQIMPLVAKEFMRQQLGELFKDKVTLPQLLIMSFLSMEGESKMTDMAHFMKVSTAAMTGIVDRLVRLGYATREYDAEDRRIIKIRLTPKGIDLVKKINQQRRQVIIKIFGKISEQDREDYLRILTQIRDILAKEEIKP
ncbi:MAG: MarR family transcriptional regulator [Candidatus Omnitrophica bacterium]|nr:MarR family transcriptional regulator [Candidatus Omnitrophota bacterium]